MTPRLIIDRIVVYVVLLALQVAMTYRLIIGVAGGNDLQAYN